MLEILNSNNLTIQYRNFMKSGGYMSITVKEIAQLAGVSRGTVDRALKNRGGVNAQTQKRILEIAKKYDYKPNLIGKALVYTNQTIKVQVILNSIGNSFFDDVKEGIFNAEKNYSNYGIKVQLTELKGYDEDEMLSHLESIDEDVKNVIITPFDNEKIRNKINELTEKGINVITLTSDLENSNRLSYIGCDYLKSGKILGRLAEIITNGKSKICVTTGSLKHSGHKDRVRGVEEILRSNSDIEIAQVIENNDDDALAYEKLSKLLAKDESIDCVCITAGGVKGSLKAIKECTRKIKVCCFDETPTSRQALKNGDILAIICQQPYEQGFNAVKTVFDKVVARQEVQPYQYTKLNIKIDQSI